MHGSPRLTRKRGRVFKHGSPHCGLLWQTQRHRSPQSRHRCKRSKRDSSCRHQKVLPNVIVAERPFGIVAQRPLGVLAQRPLGVSEIWHPMIAGRTTLSCAQWWHPAATVQASFSRNTQRRGATVDNFFYLLALQYRKKWKRKALNLCAFVLECNTVWYAEKPMPQI